MFTEQWYSGRFRDPIVTQQTMQNDIFLAIFSIKYVSYICLFTKLGQYMDFTSAVWICSGGNLSIHCPEHFIR